MTPAEMDAILERHYRAEAKGDVPGTLATFTDDIEHDVVGRPTNPIRGKAAVGDFYEGFFAEIHNERFLPVRRWYGSDFVVDEAVVEGRAIGRPFGLEGRGRRVRFRLLHIFELRDGLIARENAWLDLKALEEQLNSPS